MCAGLISSVAGSSEGEVVSGSVSASASSVSPDGAFPSLAATPLVVRGTGAGSVGRSSVGSARSGKGSVVAGGGGVMKQLLFGGDRSPVRVGSVTSETSEADEDVSVAVGPLVRQGP